MTCIEDDEAFNMYGHYDAGLARNLMIVFEKCNPDLRTCKKEKEIREWLNFKYIVTVQNRNDFIQYEFGDDSHVKQAYINFLPMSFEK